MHHSCQHAVVVPQSLQADGKVACGYLSIQYNAPDNMQNALAEAEVATEEEDE